MRSRTLPSKREALAFDADVRARRFRGSFVSLQLRAGATPMEVAAWGGHSPQVMFRHYARVIKELVGEPRLSAEAQIEAVRAALRQRSDEEVAELVGSPVEHPTADSGTEAYEVFYPI